MGQKSGQGRQGLAGLCGFAGVDVDGRATLKLCSLADVSLLQSSDAQRSGGGGDTSGQAEQGPCLFAATVCAIAPPAALHQGPMCPHVLTVPPIQGAQSYSSFTPLARLPRGPPAQV